MSNRSVRVKESILIYFRRMGWWTLGAPDSSSKTVYKIPDNIPMEVAGRAINPSQGFANSWTQHL